MRHAAIIFMVLAVATAVSAQMPKQPKFLVINTIKEDAKYALTVKSFNDMMAQPGGYNEYDLALMKEAKERSETVLKKLKQLTDEGTPDSEVIDLGDYKPTIAQLTDDMLNIHHGAAKIVSMHDLYQAGMNCAIWISDIAAGKKFNNAQASVISDNGERLKKVVASAQKLEFPESFTTKLYGQQYTLMQLKELGEYVATAGGQIKKELAAARAAKDAPFLKVLTGDKLRIFKEEFANNDGYWQCFGPGGVELTTPEQLKNAAVWYTYGNSRGLIDTWHITGYRFSGDRLSGRVSRNGIGLKPSAGSFR